MKSNRSLFAKAIISFRQHLNLLDAKAFLRVILPTLLLINLSVWFLVGQNYLWSRFDLSVSFLDIGQGNAVYARARNGQDILIDAGRGRQILGKLASVMPLGDRQIDLIIISHSDKDHIGGFSSILAKYQVKEIWTNGKDKDTQAMKGLEEAIKKEVSEGAVLKVVGAPEQKSLACNWSGLKNAQCQLEAKILSPEQPLPEGISDNDASLVVLLKTPQKSFLLTGDISSKQEARLISRNPQLTADILQVAHHGSRFSSSQEFLEKIHPEISVIQVGKNSYGHPASEVLRRLEKISGNRIYRTDTDGGVSFWFGKKNFTLKTGG